MKERLDVLLGKRNLADSREKAKALIMSGIVYVNGQKEDKAGTTFDETAPIEVRGNTLKYVSRGGLKLEKAMTHFGVELKDKICMDVGASTGGFTDCMLQNGATKVYSVDVGQDVYKRQEQIRAKNKETLMSLINSTSIDEAAKQQAIQDMIRLTEISEKENAAETLLMAKGF